MIHRHSGNVVTLDYAQSGGIPEHGIPIIAQCRERIPHRHRSDTDAKFHKSVAGRSWIDQLPQEDTANKSQSVHVIPVDLLSYRAYLNLSFSFFRTWGRVVYSMSERGSRCGSNGPCRRM